MGPTDTKELLYRTLVDYQKRVFESLGIHACSNQIEDNHALIDAEIRRLRAKP